MGAGWTATSAGLTNRSVYSLVASSTYLFAGTAYGGVWKRPLSEMVSVKEVSSGPPAAYALAQNYPNPFNPGTTIKYELPKASTAYLCVYDMLGREVSVLVDERKEAGIHEARFDGSNLASGVYLYRLTAGNFVQTRKLLLVR
jgi:hypothetical protein